MLKEQSLVKSERQTPLKEDEGRGSIAKYSSHYNTAGKPVESEDMVSHEQITFQVLDRPISPHDLPIGSVKSTELEFEEAVNHTDYSAPTNSPGTLTPGKQGQPSVL